jgi:molecular chaperone GrpE
MTDEADDDARAAEQRTQESGDGTTESEPRENGSESAAFAEEADADPTGEAADQSETGESEEAQADADQTKPVQNHSNQNQAQVAGSIVERVAAHDETLAVEIREELDAKEAELEATEEELEAKDEQIEELEGKLTRKQADFQNFKKRQQQKLADQTARATEDLVERLLPVRDNLVRALEQDADTDIREGVEGTLRELDRVLEDEGVTAIEPERGDEPDPERHEVLMRVESDQPEGTVEELYRPGYEMADRVIRTAQVTVSDSE